MKKSKKKKKSPKPDLRLYKNLSEDLDYKKRFKEQNGSCAICRRPPKRNRLARDHNHKTGKARGLLCMICNRKILGNIEKFKIIPAAIVRYLEIYDPDNPLLIKGSNEKTQASPEQASI